MVTLKDFFSFQKNRFFWINLIAMIVVIIAVCWGTLYGLDIYTHHGESYVVPNVKNKSSAGSREITECPATESNYR